MCAAKVIVSGMRPTGRLHLGHYHGVIANWVKLQNDSSFAACYFFVADLHSLTTDYDNTTLVKRHIQDILLDWISAGVNPDKAVIFVQSAVPEHAELHLLLSMITPVAWLERVPSYKDLQTELSNKDLSTYGFLGYPLLQTADVAIYDGTHVPVGLDQVPHIELSREIVRRFNFIYKTVALQEPQPLLTPTPKLPGTDGRKMSKSYDNSIFLSDTAAEAQQKIMTAMTDPARKRRTDPGDPDKCPVFDYHKIYSTAAVQAEVAAGCRSAGIGCIDCKKKLLVGMEATLAPLREKRAQLSAQPKLITDIVAAGNARARSVARENLTRIKDVVGI
jgi:tryptophanyl-tRNA synthetase